MNEHLVWINGELRPVAQAHISVADRGFLSGDGVFEAIKAIDGTAFALSRHLRRLERSARAIGLPAPDLDALASAISDTLAANRARCGDSARVRITLTAGVGEGIHRIPGASTLVVAADPLPVLPATGSVITSPWPRNERSATAGAKTTSYAENAAILAFAREHGCDEALLADTRGRLSEGTTCNVIIEHRGELLTPSTATGCLGGVTRDLVLEWGIARETDVPMSALAQATEVLLSSTSRDLQPVGRVDGRELPAPGPLGATAMAEFARCAARNSDP